MQFRTVFLTALLATTIAACADRAEPPGPMLRHGLQELNDQRLHLPRASGDHPNREYLEERCSAFRAA